MLAHVNVAPGIDLEVRVRDPQGSVRGLAIVAHPLGRLGGSFDDPVVRALVDYFDDRRNLRVVSFNSRGVGGSSGSASWTGKAECDDYQVLLDWAMTAYVHDYPQTTQSELHICGYSAGALYASTTRVRPVLYLLKHWANGGRPHYVLISYPVDMVWALSMFRTSFFQTALEGLLRARKNAANSHVAAGQLPEARSLVGGQAAGKDSEGNQDVAADVLVIFGLQDQFTKEASYERWVSRLLELAPTPDSNSAALPSGAYTSAQAHDAEQSTVEECRVDGADHFWNRGSALDRLISAVESWNGKLARGIA